MVMKPASRRAFLRRTSLVAAAPCVLQMARAAEPAPALHLPHGRTPSYRDHHPIDPGRIIRKIETFTRGSIGLVRVTTDDGLTGYGQMSTYDVGLTADVLHRKVAGNFLGRDAADIDALVDRCIEAHYKFPWSFVCRALTGIETALWDLYGKARSKPVCELIGGRSTALTAYGSSMRRDISPRDEAERLVRLRDELGYTAFKVRVGQVNGHDRDASPGRTEQLIPAIRRRLGDGVRLLADGNSGYTPPRAIEVGRLMEQNGYEHFEEPCPYWELEWTAEVAAALQVPVAGGEQDNDLAQWRRMLRLNAVDVAQPDICYLGGVVRTLRVAAMAAELGKPVVPHAANLALVTLFTLHVLAAIPNAGPYVEFSIESEAGVNREAESMYAPFLSVKDGRVQIPAGPGWGVTILPDWLAGATHQVSEA